MLVLCAVPFWLAIYGFIIGSLVFILILLTVPVLKEVL
jgi:hypothetical protein